MKLNELGFFAIISHSCGEEDAPTFSLPATLGKGVATSSFTVWIKRFADTHVLSDTAGEVTIVFYGHVCGDLSRSQIVDAYKAQGISFVEALNGSFAFLLIDKPRDKVVLATDRLGSRKIYMRQQDSMTVVSTVLKHLFTNDTSLDPIGVAWYLSNGVFHHHRTMLEGVSKLDRASICTFGGHRERNGKAPGQMRRYWQYGFTREYAHKEIGQVKKELEALLVQSVRRRVSDNDPVMISLSAGYDSPGVLGILRERLHIENMQAFSHGLREDDEKSDAYLSRRLAEMYGIEHRFFHPYDGDLCGTIELNAMWGNGVAHFCDEASLWCAFYDQYAGKNFILFVAEEGFGGIGRNAELFHNEEILAICKILDFTSLRWLKRFLPQGVYRTFVEGQREDIAAIFDSLPPITDIHDIKDFIYLDQRLSCVHMPWREYFAGRIFRVQNPFLDNDVLDFVRKLPSEWRRGKRLYKETIAAMFPEIFAINRATVGGFVPDEMWIEDMHRERGLIKERYLPNGSSSMLDALIPSDSINELLWMEEEIPDKIGLAVEKMMSLSNRVVNKVKREIGAEKIKKRRRFLVGRTEFLLRYLVLRRFLEIAEQDSLLLELGI
jgi:asparagine synthase (glutamine-hydrolysing)